jgi:hypothetical protein
MKIKDDDIVQLTLVRIDIEKSSYILSQICDRYEIVFGMNTNELEQLANIIIELTKAQKTINEMIKENYL